MNKWEAIAAMVVAIGFFAALASTAFSDGDRVELAAAGLEECPIKIDNYNTIWVKDCVKYTQMLNELEEK